MTVGFDTFFHKTVSTKFVVRNITDQRGGKDKEKVVRVFGYPVNPGDTRDLLTIPSVSEADIRHALLKGDLMLKLRYEELEVVDSNIDLLQFDKTGLNNQRDFLIQHGITYGIDAGGGTADLVPFFQDVPVSGIQNGINTIFFVPDIFLYTTENKLTLYLNGVRQAIGDNYLIGESGGLGTGYDTIVFLEAPRTKDIVLVDYFKA